MKTAPQHYFKNHSEFREWLALNHDKSEGINVVMYKVDDPRPSMRWEEAVKVALCYGWIDSTVRRIGDGARAQYFCKRKPKSVWSKLNKGYIKELKKDGLMTESGLASIKIAIENGSWTTLDDVENGVVPEDLQIAFKRNKKAQENFLGFTKGQRKSYLYWLNQAKRTETRLKRINEIIRLSEAGIKSRN